VDVDKDENLYPQMHTDKSESYIREKGKRKNNN